MSAATAAGPPLAAPHINVDQAEKMANLIAAKNAVQRGWARLLAAPRRAWDFLKRALHLQPAVDMVANATAPLRAAAAKAIKVVGPVEAAALTVSTRTGQSVLKHTVGRALRWLGKGASWLYNGGLWAISLVSQKAAANVDNWVCDKVFEPVYTAYKTNVPKIREFFNPASDGMRSVQAIALFSSALRIARTYLPRPWNYVAMVVTGMFLADRYKDLGQDKVEAVVTEAVVTEAVVTEAAPAETVLVDGEPHTVMPVSGTATVTGPQGGTYEVPVTGVAVPADAAEKLPETMSEIVVDAEAVAPDGQPDEPVVVANREAKRAVDKVELTREQRQSKKQKSTNRR